MRRIKSYPGHHNHDHVSFSIWWDFICGPEVWWPSARSTCKTKVERLFVQSNHTPGSPCHIFFRKFMFLELFPSQSVSGRWHQESPKQASKCKIMLDCTCRESYVLLYKMCCCCCFFFHNGAVHDRTRGSLAHMQNPTRFILIASDTFDCWHFYSLNNYGP